MSSAALGVDSTMRIHDALATLARDDAARSERALPRLLAGRLEQPLHVVYGGAHLFKKDTVQKVGNLARQAFERHAPDATTFAEALGLPSTLDASSRAAVHARVGQKLASNAVEDYRIDFEDGYGLRGEEEENGHVESAARALAEAAAEGLLSPRIGVRIKSLARETRERALRTLESFLAITAASARAPSGATSPLPAGFVITLPKVVSEVEVAVLTDLLDANERALGLEHGTIGIEIMIEQPEALLDADSGQCVLPRLVRAARGRCSALHLGSYDLLASLGVAASEQRLTHPACDFAKQLMLVAVVRSGVALSDGATTTMPIEPHKSPIGAAQRDENRAAVHAAWRLHAHNVRHGLVQGLYQGWDLHPAQIPARYGAVFAFFAEAAPVMEARLQSFLDRAARASRVGQAFDDAATGQGLLNFFDRAVRTGALDSAVLDRIGVTLEDVRSRSFAELARLA